MQCMQRDSWINLRHTLYIGALRLTSDTADTDNSDCLLNRRKRLQDVSLEHIANTDIIIGIGWHRRRWCTTGAIGDNLACADPWVLWEVWYSYWCHSIWHAGKFQSSFERFARGRHHYTVSKPGKVAVCRRRRSWKRWGFSTGTTIHIWIFILSQKLLVDRYHFTLNEFIIGDTEAICGY